MANFRPNTPDCMAMSLRSTPGPTTMKTRRDVRLNWLRPDATNASASEQIDSSTAKPAIVMTAVTLCPATVSSTRRGTRTCNAAATAAPTMRYPPACKRSCTAAARKRSHLLPVCTIFASAFSTIAVLPKASHSQPIVIDMIIDPTNLAIQTWGLFGNATAVDTMTTGFTAGAASKNVRATAGFTPLPMRRPAIGTEPHSQPGSAMPQRPARGTAKTGRLGNHRFREFSVRSAAIAPDNVTPRARKGSACTQTATKMVDQVRKARLSS